MRTEKETAAENTETENTIDRYETAASDLGWSGPYKDKYGATYFEDQTDGQTWCAATWEDLCKAFDIEPSEESTGPDDADQKVYKYGKPDKYGDFPYLYSGSYKNEDLDLILRERLPANYNMQIVDPIESRILADLSKLGIDAHLQAMIQNEPDRLVNRMIGEKVIMRHHELDFSPDGMICLIRRLKEYDPSQFDYSDLDPKIVTDYDWTEETEEQYRDGLPFDLYSAAHSLRSCILETLQIEDLSC